MSALLPGRPGADPRCAWMAGGGVAGGSQDPPAGAHRETHRRAAARRLGHRERAGAPALRRAQRGRGGLSPAGRDLQVPLLGPAGRTVRRAPVPRAAVHRGDPARRGRCSATSRGHPRRGCPVRVPDLLARPRPFLRAAARPAPRGGDPHGARSGAVRDRAGGHRRPAAGAGVHPAPERPHRLRSRALPAGPRSLPVCPKHARVAGIRGVRGAGGPRGQDDPPGTSRSSPA